MLKQTSARFYYSAVDGTGKEVLRSRTVSNVDILAGDTEINTLASAFEALTEDAYAVVEKIQTYVIR